MTDIILKHYGDIDVDTLTRERLKMWLSESGRKDVDTVPVESVIVHMMIWAGKWKKEIVTLKQKRNAETDTKLCLHSRRIAGGTKADGQSAEEPKGNTPCRRRGHFRNAGQPESKEHHQIFGHEGDSAPTASEHRSESKARRERTEAKTQPKASVAGVEKRKKHDGRSYRQPAKREVIDRPEHIDALQNYADKFNINIFDSNATGKPSTGAIYHDRSSKGIKNGKRVYNDCWRAEINIAGDRYRHRSKDRDDCVAWLKAVKQGKIKPTDNKADWWRMEQRKDDNVRVDEIIVSAAEESAMLYDYHQTGDMAKINEYLVKRLLPHMAYYCAHTLKFGESRTITASRQAAALLLTRITAGKPIVNFTATCKRMLRMHKKRGNFFYYENAVEPVRLMVDGINFDALAEIWKVTKDRRI